MGNTCSRFVQGVTAWVWRVYELLPALRWPALQQTTNISGDVINNIYRGSEPPDREKLAELLQKCTKQSATKYTESKNGRALPAEWNRIRWAPLEVTTDIKKSLDRIDVRYGQRMNNANNFPISQLLQSTLYGVGRRQSRNDTTATSSKIIALIGEAGIGKTTSMKVLTKAEFVEARQEGSDDDATKYAFNVGLRDVNYGKEMFLLEFLTTGAAAADTAELLRGQDDESLKTMLDILYQSRQVLITLDGLDEANIDDLSQKVPKLHYYDKGTAEQILMNVLSGEMMPNATVVVTSRPNQVYELHPEYRPACIAEVKGFDARAQDFICQQLCGVHYLAVKEFLCIRPALANLCYVPINCILIMLALCRMHEQDEGHRWSVETMTDVIAYVVCTYVRSDHLTANADVEDLLREICKLAWNGKKRRKYVFTKKNLTDWEVDLHENQQDFLYLFTSVECDLLMRILQGEKRRSFSHLTWQDFFAAMFLMFFISNRQFEEFLKVQGRKDYMQSVLRFCFGMCDKMVRKEIEALIPRSMMSPHKVTTLTRLITPSRKEDEIVKHCGWAKEARHENVTAKASKSLTCKLRLGGRGKTILQDGANSVAYVIQRSRRSFEVEMDESRFQGNAFQLFLPSISSYDVEQPQQAQGGTMRNTVTKLYLRNCNLSETDIKKLAEKLISDELQKPMEIIDLSSNKVTRAAACQLSRCLRKVRELNLSNCQIGESGRDQLCREMRRIPRSQRPKVTGVNLFFGA